MNEVDIETLKKVNASLAKKWNVRKCSEKLVKAYHNYMSMIDKALPITESLTVYDLVKLNKIPDIGETIIEKGFGNLFKSPPCMVVPGYMILKVSYPPGHNLLELPGTIITYPGEKFCVSDIHKVSSRITIIESKFVGYEHHVSPNGKIVQK